MMEAADRRSRSSRIHSKHGGLEEIRVASFYEARKTPLVLSEKTLRDWLASLEKGLEKKRNILVPIKDERT